MRSGAMVGRRKAGFWHIQLGSLFFVGREKFAPARHSADRRHRNNNLLSLMPKISLVVCLHREKDLLERLLQHTQDCYDDLVVVHDGVETSAPPSHQTQQTSPEQLSLSFPQAPPIELARDYSELPRNSSLPSGYRLRTEPDSSGSIQELVHQYKGKFYEGPRCFQQEPHWPFAWWAAKYDWILRLDADEYPSEALRIWLKDFRKRLSPPNSICGFLCTWPFWDGTREFTIDYTESRPFLIHKHRVSFIGMAEQGPIPLSKWDATGLTLHHRPARPSFGLSYIFFRKQSYRWRKCIAGSLLRRTIDLPRWNYHEETWPTHWAQIVERPWLIGIRRFVRFLFSSFRMARNHNFAFWKSHFLATPCHQLCISWTFGFFQLSQKFKCSKSFTGNAQNSLR